MYARVYYALRNTICRTLTPDMLRYHFLYSLVIILIIVIIIITIIIIYDSTTCRLFQRICDNVRTYNIINNVCSSLAGTRDGFPFVSTLWLELSSASRYIKYNIIIMLCIINTSDIPVCVCGVFG